MPVRLLVVLACAASLSACQVDLLGGDCRKIGGSGYSLCMAEDNATFYLEPNGVSPSGGGVLEGTVTSIGWDARVILVRRRAIFRGDPDGLMIVAKGTVDGPVADEASLLKAYPAITLVAPNKAWDAL